jgi:hypothetical protein
VGLGVQVDYKHPLSILGKGCAKVYGRGCFAASPFLICYSNRLHVGSSLIFDKALLFTVLV